MSPVIIVHKGDREYGHSGIAGPDRLNRYLEHWVRCRRCPWCLHAAKREWITRMTREIMMAQRSWLVTLTFAPEAHDALLARAIAATHLDGVEWENLSEDERFKRWDRVEYCEVAKYLKRLRKSVGRDVRMCCVTEAHKSGRPHYHLVLHEPNGGAPITWRKITAPWKLGFPAAVLVKEGPKAAYYVGKYLGKSVRARVRASQRYGECQADLCP